MRNILSAAYFSLVIFLSAYSAAVAADASAVNTSAAYSEVAARTQAVNANFYVYKDADSGFNHGFPSGYFADPLSLVYDIQVNTACIDDLTAPSGCASDPNALDRVRINVMQVVLPPMTSDQFSGVNIEEPQNWGAQPRGIGYDLRGSSQVVFDARSPDKAQVQFGVGGCVTPFVTLSPQWQTFQIDLSSLLPPEGIQTTCPPDLGNVHILFSIATAGDQAPAGATRTTARRTRNSSIWGSRPRTTPTSSPPSRNSPPSNRRSATPPRRRCGRRARTARATTSWRCTTAAAAAFSAARCRAARCRVPASLPTARSAATR